MSDTAGLDVAIFRCPKASLYVYGKEGSLSGTTVSHTINSSPCDSTVQIPMDETETCKRQVLAEIQEQAVVGLVEDLLRIPSLQDEETAIAEFIGRFMERNGIAVDLHEVESGRLQPVGRIRGASDHVTLALCGHMDTQPVPMEYADDPYAPYVDDGLLFGHGVGNMKAGLGAALSAAAALQRVKIPLRSTLLVMPVVGEHQGGVGTEYNIRHVAVPDMAIVNESTSLSLLTKSPSSISVLVSTIGDTRHISRLHHPPPPVNAITQMSRVIEALPTMELTHAPSPDYPELPRLNIGAIMGGQGRDYNIHRDTTTASYCTISLNVRAPVGVTADSVKRDLTAFLETMKATDPSLNYEVEVPPATYRAPWRVKKLFMPGNDLPIDAPIVQTLRRNHVYVTGTEPQVGTKKYSTDDAGRLTLAGSQALSYGPGRGARTARRESVVVETIVTCAKVLAATAVEVCRTRHPRRRRSS